MHSGGNDHTLTAPVGDSGTQKGSIFAVTQGNVCLQVRLGGLLVRNGFSCKGCLVNAEIDSLHQAHIRGDEIARFDEDNISWNEVTRGDRLAVPIA